MRTMDMGNSLAEKGKGATHGADAHCPGCAGASQIFGWKQKPKAKSRVQVQVQVQSPTADAPALCGGLWVHGTRCKYVL